MKKTTLLIANRGEIAIRIARAAAELDIRTVSIYSEDDASSPHVRSSDESRALRGRGAAAYLDIEQIVALAREAHCGAIHPGYGFLSENAEFARRCEAQGLVFVGPTPETLALFGDKSRAREFALRCDVPVVPGTAGPASLEEIEAFMRAQESGRAIIIKAIAGGGGRGMRVVEHLKDVAPAFEQCRSEAQAAFGSPAVYAERLVKFARHVEVQIVGDGHGGVISLGERECSLQRRNQKLVEFAPGLGVDAAIRQRLIDYSLGMAKEAGYRSLGTFEFLVEQAEGAAEVAVAFIEANPRLQVEHTVTEMVSGVDLVQVQLRIALGARLGDLGLSAGVPMRGCAVQLRINMERMDRDGSARPGGGLISAFELPSGPGVRVDTFGEVGYRSNPNFDSLLAKLIVYTQSNDTGVLLRKALRALRDFRIVGVPTNKVLLAGLLENEAVRAGRIHTRFVEENLSALLDAGAGMAQDSLPAPIAAQAGEDPLEAPEDGGSHIRAPMQGMVISVDVAAGDQIQQGQVVAVLEAMKMQHAIHADRPGIVRRLLVEAGATVMEGRGLLEVEFGESDGRTHDSAASVAVDAVPAALAEVLQRQAMVLDAARPEAVARRHARKQRTARENVADLMDPQSFTEYGALAIAAQRSRRSLEDLIANTPADGIVIGVGTVNAQVFGADVSRCMVLAYDYTVLAGTQGRVSHDKTDRALLLAEKWAIPVVLFAEGGGGRPGDVDSAKVPKLNIPTFARFARLSGLAPRVGIVSGYSFAGNAALLGCCDVIIATRNASFGMAGPAMIEGAGLGACAPAEVGPIQVQGPNGVIDILVADEAEAVQAAKKYLGYFQGDVKDGWRAADPRALRHLIPENRLQSYDVRRVVAALADEQSVLELRPSFGIGVLTFLVRIEGKAFGVMANNPRHLGGAIDAAAGDKAARFMQLCDAFDIPMVSLCDTPGFMVGPEAEKTGLVRHVCRMFITAANLSIPFVAVVLRKGYGLGAQAMTAGGFHEPLMTVAWPTAEFGGMGIEGSVRLGYKKELEGIADAQARQARFEELVESEYARGKAVHVASHAIIDDVIDPADTRARILAAVNAVHTAPRRSGKKRAFVDVW